MVDSASFGFTLVSRLAARHDAGTPECSFRDIDIIGLRDGCLTARWSAARLLSIRLANFISIDTFERDFRESVRASMPFRRRHSVTAVTPMAALRSLAASMRPGLHSMRSRNTGAGRRMRRRISLGSPQPTRYRAPLYSASADAADWRQRPRLMPEIALAASSATGISLPTSRPEPFAISRPLHSLKCRPTRVTRRHSQPSAAAAATAHLHRASNECRSYSRLHDVAL